MASMAMGTAALASLHPTSPEEAVVVEEEAEVALRPQHAAAVETVAKSCRRS